MAKCNLIKISLRYLIIIWVCINGNKALAAPQINNLIIPISYFVNHKKQLKEIKEYLNKYRKVSIIGTSGIGKTQLARVYVQDNKDSYNIIWFFDCNLDLKEEFVKLAKHLNQVLKINIAEEANSAQQAVVNYLLSQNKWLLVFDNLKIGENKKLKELIDGKYNGDIIFCSQDRDGLSNILEMPLLDRENTVFLIKSLLDDKNDKDIEFLLKVFSGYPILIVQGAQLLNKIKGLNKEEYKKKIYQASDKIEVNINMAIKELSPTAVNLLSKIALINNQSFSKQLLSFIIDNQETLEDDIGELSKFLLIYNSDSNEENPVFEMHDIIANKIQKINGNRTNKIYLEDIILKLMNNIPSYSIQAYLFRNAKTIRDNLKIVSNNAPKYNVNIYKLMELNLQLMSQYVNSFDSYECEKLIDWFDINEQQGKFKLWLMSNYEKTIYASYLKLIGWHYRSIYKWPKALEHYTRSQNILNNIKGTEPVQYGLFYCLAEINIMLGDSQTAQKYIHLMEKVFSSGVLEDTEEVPVTLFTVKANLFYLQEKYEEALEELNKAIKMLLVNTTDSKDLILSVRYLLKSKILNSLGKYQEAYAQLQQSYSVGTTREKENHAIYARIYTQFARSELGQGELSKALEHINLAIEILLADERRNPKDADYSEDADLAASYVTQGEIFFAKNNLKAAIDSYKKASIIYFYLYGKNLKNVGHVSYLYLQGAKAACKSKDLYNYKFFSNQQIQEFGVQHPNTIAILKYCKQYQINPG